MDKNNTSTENEAACDVQQEVAQTAVLAVAQPTKKRFEVDIFNKIVTGEGQTEQMHLEKVHYDKPVIIEAASEQDLKDFAEKLSICQQTFKIVRVLDDVPAAPLKQTQQRQMQHQAIHDTSLQHQAEAPKQDACSSAQTCLRQKPKYYKIGNIEIKDDNGKIFQKQWLKLTDEEMANFRIVNSKTNALVSMKDRHLEMKKWVLVEMTDDASASIEENMR